MFFLKFAKSEKNVDFPSIAICNSNPFLTNYSIDFIVEFLENTTNFSYAHSGHVTKLNYLNELFNDNTVRIKNKK